MSTVNHQAIAQRLTTDRLGSYLAATGGDLAHAVELYDWNIEIGGAFHEDIGRLEVVFRNAIDGALVAYGVAQGWPQPWYQRSALFPGKHGQRALADIRAARDRATRYNRPEVHGKVIAELTFGFWRFLCPKTYLTSMWVPAVAGAFPNHPDAGDPRRLRRDVEDRIQRIHYLRNRIAHHEPIHQRNLQRDLTGIENVVGWICADTHSWITATSRVRTVLQARP